MAGAAPSLSKEWFTAAELAELGLPDLPTEKKNVLLMAERRAWTRADREGRLWRPRRGRGGGIELHYTALPPAAQVQLAIRFAQAPADGDGPPPESARAEAWAQFDLMPDHKKAEARRRMEAIEAVRALQRAGVPKTVAAQQIAPRFDVALSGLYRWETAVNGIERCDWLPFLAPRHAGRSGETECSPEAWDFLLADFLRLSQPPFSACFRRLADKVRDEGLDWSVPARTTLQRRVEALPPALLVLCREGEEAVKRLYPAQRRTRGHFHALEAVNADGHKWDVFVRWPDGQVSRPVMVAFQDLYSGLVLSWRVDRTENKECVRLAFGDMVERWGIPSHCWLDNGRNFASKWLTGRTATRFRFKVRDEEPEGILTALGVQVHWTTPYSGQSKPIERAFGEFAGNIAKHPRFEGAYTGNSPEAKPENYGNSAVPLDTFLEVVAGGIAEHNARLGRRSQVCRGVLSFQQVFDASYADAPIQRATEAQRRLWLMAAEDVAVGRRDGCIEIMGNRYWAEGLLALRGQRVVARFDPEALHQDLHVYRADGVYVGAAPCVAAVGFDDVAAARAHAQARGQWLRGVRMQRDAERRMTLDELARQLPAPPEPAAPPEPCVVRLVTGNTVREVQQQHDDEEQPEWERLMLRAGEMRRAERGESAAFTRGAQLRIVPDAEDGD